MPYGNQRASAGVGEALLLKPTPIRGSLLVIRPEWRKPSRAALSGSVDVVGSTLVLREQEPTGRLSITVLENLPSALCFWSFVVSSGKLCIWFSMTN